MNAWELKRTAVLFQVQKARNVSTIVVKKKGSERNHFQDTETFCAKIDIRKEDLCDFDLAES